MTRQFTIFAIFVKRIWAICIGEHCLIKKVIVALLCHIILHLLKLLAHTDRFYLICGATAQKLILVHSRLHSSIHLEEHIIILILPRL